MSICPNCDSDCETSFCHNCGQKQNIQFNIHNIWAATLEAFTLNKGVLYTYRELFRNPGQLSAKYLAGKTKSFTNPILFLLFNLSLLVLWGSIVDRGTTLNQADEIKFILKFSIPLALGFSLSHYIVFLFKKYTFIEHLIASIFFSSYTLVYFIPYLLLKNNFGQELAQFLLLVPVVVVTFTFQHQLKRISILKFANSLLSIVFILVAAILFANFFDFVFSKFF